MMRSGYALVDKAGAVLHVWGEIPNLLKLPNGQAVQPGAVGAYDGGNFNVVERWIDGDDPPSGFESGADTVAFDGQKVVVARTSKRPPLDVRKAQMSGDVDALFDEKLYGGFTYDFGGDVGPRTLQTRQDDQTFWLALKDACNDAIMAGQEKDLSPIPIRPLDNININATFGEIANALRAMRAQQATILAASWAIKDAIAAAVDHAGLDLIDITAGWPEPDRDPRLGNAST